MNTVPYTNARRAGRTSGALVLKLDPMYAAAGDNTPKEGDVVTFRGVEFVYRYATPKFGERNRRARRARGIGVRKPVRLHAGRRPVVYVPPAPVEDVPAPEPGELAEAIAARYVPPAEPRFCGELPEVTA